MIRTGQALSAAAAALAFAVMVARHQYPSEDAFEGTGGGLVPLAWLALPLALAGTALARGAAPSWGETLPGIALAGWTLLSARHAAYPFAASAFAAEWLALAALWFAVRTWPLPARVRFAGLAVAALAAGHAAAALHERAVVLPELLAKFRRGDADVLRGLEALGMEPSFLLRSRLEALLPQSSFGHSNSLAGMLALGAVAWLALAAGAWRTAGWAGRASRFASVAGLAGIALALAATKCRSAQAGLAVGLAAWVLLRPAGRAAFRRQWRWWALAAALAMVAFSTAATLGRLGSAGESFRYRLEWWRGSGGVLAAAPWTGVGFGGFRDEYLLHKAPESSEEIADPHNFMVEWACCAGAPALALYLLWLVAGVRAAAATSPPEPLPSVAERWSPWIAFAVLAAGLALAAKLRGEADPDRWLAMAGGLILAAAAQRLAVPATVQVWRTAAAAGAIGLHVHLLAAGGASAPALQLPMWLWLAAAAPDSRDRRAPAWGWGLLLAGMAAAAPLAWGIARRDQLALAVRIARGRDDPGVKFRGLAAAAERVPGDAAGWQRLAAAAEQNKDFAEAESALRKAVAVRPGRAALRRELAALRWRTAAAPADFAGVAEGLAAAAARNPTSAELAWTLAFVQAAGDHDRPADLLARQARWLDPARHADEARDDGFARRQRGAAHPAARKALELDAATPHLDKKLTAARRAWARGLLAGGTMGEQGR